MVGLPIYCTPKPPISLGFSAELPYEGSFTEVLQGVRHDGSHEGSPVPLFPFPPVPCSLFVIKFLVLSS